MFRNILQQGGYKPFKHSEAGCLETFYNGCSDNSEAGCSEIFCSRVVINVLKQGGYKHSEAGCSETFCMQGVKKHSAAGMLRNILRQDVQKHSKAGCSETF